MLINKGAAPFDAFYAERALAGENMSRNQCKTILITAAIVIVLADAASAFAFSPASKPSSAGVIAQEIRGGGGFRRMGPEGFGVGRDFAGRRAIGWLAGADALAVATSPAPDDDSCWYYTDPSQSAGYWGDCPQ